MKNNENLDDDNLDEFDDVKINQPTIKGKRILLFVVPLIFFLLGGIAYFLIKMSDNYQSNADKKVKEEKEAKNEYHYYDMDKIVTSLSSSSDKRKFIKISLSLQFSNEQTEELIESKLPLIKDSLQTFLRELRTDDLSGTAGVIMLKTELIKRINKIIEPKEVTDILFKEILMN